MIIPLCCVRPSKIRSVIILEIIYEMADEWSFTLSGLRAAL